MSSKLDFLPPKLPFEGDRDSLRRTVLAPGNYAPPALHPFTIHSSQGFGRLGAPIGRFDVRLREIITLEKKRFAGTFRNPWALGEALSGSDRGGEPRIIPAQSHVEVS